MEIRLYQNGDAEAISAFMKRCFLQNTQSEVRSHEADYYAWKYSQNPFGKPAVQVVEDNQKIVGLFSVVPKPLKVGDKVIIAGETGDAYIDPTFQGKGLFFKMVANAFSEIKKQGITSFYTTANDVALKIWTGLFRYEKLFDYRSLVRPLNLKNILQKKTRLGPLSSLFNSIFLLPYMMFFRKLEDQFEGYNFEKLGRFSDFNFDLFWKERGSSYAMTVEKKSSYFRDRFEDNPEQFYPYLFRKGKDVLGYSVLKYTACYGFKCGHIVDYMVADGDASSMEKLIAFSLNALRKNGADMASTWAIPNHFTYKVMKRFGFWTRKKKFHIVAGGDILKDPQFVKMKNPAMWSFTHGDSDNV